MRVSFFAASLLLSGCFGIARDRAETDDRVGIATEAGWRIRAEDGLAAVRSLSEEELSLWMGAPELDVRIDNDALAPRALTIRAENLLVTAGLELVPDAGPSIPILELDRPRPTARVVRVELPAESGATLRLRDAEPPTEEWSFLVFGDVQEAIDRVEDVYFRMNEEDARFVLLVGDLTVTGAVSELERFDEELTKLAIPCYATLGNHELGVANTPYHRFYGRGSYRFEYEGFRFIMIDSANATVAPRVYSWLEAWLDEPPSDTPTFVGMHIPPIDPVGARTGAFASRLEAHKLLSVLARRPVVATFYGHIHTFRAFSNAGIPAYITGGGGAIPDRWDGIGRHFLRVFVEPGVPKPTVGLVRVDR